MQGEWLGIVLDIKNKKRGDKQPCCQERGLFFRSKIALRAAEMRKPKELFDKKGKGEQQQDKEGQAKPRG